MPNLRGGKAYKKSKDKSKQDDKEMDAVFIEKAEDQFVGRITKLLGNRNVNVYCEDKIDRNCKIRTGIKKKETRFDIGDVVLLSLRYCDMSKADLEKGLKPDRGDILAKYHIQQYASLKEEGINPAVFAHLDSAHAAEDIFDRTGTTNDDMEEDLNVEDI